VSHAFKIQEFNVSVRNTKPAQEPTGFEAHRAAKDKAGSVSAVETMITPALVSNFEAASQAIVCTLSIVCTARRIEADPPRRCLLSFAGQVLCNVNHLSYSITEFVDKNNDYRY
jgi:hypothetical protein